MDNNTFPENDVTAKKLILNILAGLFLAKLYFTTNFDSQGLYVDKAPKGK